MFLVHIFYRYEIFTSCEILARLLTMTCRFTSEIKLDIDDFYFVFACILTFMLKFLPSFIEKLLPLRRIYFFNDDNFDNATNLFLIFSLNNDIFESLYETCLKIIIIIINQESCKSRSFLQLKKVDLTS